MKKLFTEHPASVGETYGEHMIAALSYSGHLLKAGVCCLIHAFLPFLFTRTARDTIIELNDRLVMNRAQEKARREARRAAASH